MTANDRQTLEADIVCVGFGPAVGGFLTTILPVLSELPLQVLCYERADDISFGVSGVVSKARAIRRSFPDLDAAEIPMAFPVKKEKVLYLLDPHGASHRAAGLRMVDRLTRTFNKILPYKDLAVDLPYIPSFLSKEHGLLFSVGQLNQWVGSRIMASGLVQIWPGMPVQEPLFEGDKVVGVRLADQGTTKNGEPDLNFMPGMDIRAALTVVGDGPVGSVGQKLNEHFGMPEGHHQRDWAIGMKMLVELPENCPLEPGTVFHTLGYPEPEIFGFLYVYPDRMASIGIFVPSWFDSPVRTSYRYLQHWMTHPYLWKYLKGSVMRSWGAKSLQESGKRGEPFLAGDGYARIGEGSGSTNVLTGSGVDEAWETGVQLAEAVIELSKAGKPFTKKNLNETYVAKRRSSWVEKEAKVAEKARDGFQNGFIRGLVGMTLTGMTGGKINMPGKSVRPHDRIPTLEEYYQGRISLEEIEQIRKECQAGGLSLHNALMDRCGWPKIELDGKLLVSHQDALLMGGKVQAPSGFADHVTFKDLETCRQCNAKICIEGCSGQAITPGEDGVPGFDREKCVFCGACLWNCSKPDPNDPERGNIAFRTGAGGLHSTVN